MTLKELMTARGTTVRKGPIMSDDFVIAINASRPCDADLHPDNYIVVQDSVSSVTAAINPTTQSKSYIREGTKTNKTGTNRTYNVTGDRNTPSDFQDFVFSYETIYGVGSDVIVDYVRFNMLDFTGEKGKVTISVNNDGSGDSENNATFDVDLLKAGSVPEQYTYTPEGTLGTLSVTSVVGSSTGNTTVTVIPSLAAGQTAKYKTAASVTIPAYGGTATTGWSDFTSGSEYTATSGNEFVVVYLDSNNKVVSAGKTTATVA